MTRIKIKICTLTEEYIKKKKVLYLLLKIAKKGELERQSLFSPLLESAPKDLPRTMSQVSEEKLESSFDL